MPGGRLTYEERRRIAAGLAMGRSYAEIGRALDRPGSTVSREVARNGGPHRYRPEQAQQATRWRARRRGPALPPPLPVVTGDAAPDPRRLLEFEERFADMGARTGLPPMASRVLAALYVSDTGGLTAAELVAHLQVSAASVSKAVTWLADLGLIRRERTGRRERHIVDDHVWYHAWMASVRTMTVWADFAQEGAALFGPSSPAGVRFHITGDFFRRLSHDMVEAAEHWRQTLSPPDVR